MRHGKHHYIPEPLREATSKDHNVYVVVVALKVAPHHIFSSALIVGWLKGF